MMAGRLQGSFEYPQGQCVRYDLKPAVNRQRGDREEDS